MEVVRSWARASRRVHLDAIVIALLFLTTAVISYDALQKRGLGIFFQDVFSPAVVLACTGKYEAVALNESLRLFLELKTQSFDCADLPPAPEGRTPLLSLQYQTMYLIGAAGLVWSFTGVVWNSLIGIGAFLGACLAIAVYGVGRLFLPIPLALALAYVAVTSPVNFDMLPHLRDYAKAPFIVGFLFFSGWLLKSWPNRRRLLVAAAGAGLVAGLGFGIRTDLLLALPFFAIVLLILLMITRLRAALMCGVAAATFAVSFGIAASPVLQAYRGGGQVGHVALLGATTPFNAPLGVTTQIYDVGHAYLDEFIYGMTHAYAFGAQEANAPPPNLTFLGEDYGRASLRALLAFAANFPADIVLRAYASIINVLSLDFGSGPSLHRAAGVIVAVLAIAFVGSTTASMAVFLASAILYFGGSSALQFHARHVFYLEFVAWLCIVIVAFWGVTVGLRALAGSAARPLTSDVTLSAFSGTLWLTEKRFGVEIKCVVKALAFVLAGLLLMMLLLATTRWYQQAHATSLFMRYLSTERQPVALDESASGDRVLLRPAGMVPDMSGRVTEYSLPFNGFYFVLVLDGRGCDSSTFTATTVYRNASPSFSREFHVGLQSDGRKSYLLFPIVNCDARCSLTRFEGISVPSHQRTCLASFEAVTNYRVLPLPLWLRLPAGWEEMPLYQRLEKSLWPF